MAVGPVFVVAGHAAPWLYNL